MCDEPVATRVVTPEGTLDFQEYFVHRRTEVAIRAVEVRGLAQADPAPGVLESIDSAEAIFVCPSNPFVSIGNTRSVVAVVADGRFYSATELNKLRLRLLELAAK